MKKIFLIICFLITLTASIFAQNELNFEFDYARFNYDSASVYLEFYYDLNPKNMSSTPTDKGDLSEAIVHLEMKNMITNEYAINKDWRIQNIVAPDEKDSVIKSVGDVLGFVIPTGKYSLLMVVRDSKDPNLKKTITETIVIEPFKPNKYSISDIEIARNIKKDDVDKNSLFYKNSMEIFPNPSMVYTSQLPALFFYSELYNLKLADATTEFSLVRNLYNSAGVSVHKNSKIIKQTDQALVEFGVVNLSKYPTDSYSLELCLVDRSNNQAFTSTKRFYLYNPKVADPNKNANVTAGVLGSEYSILSLEECNKMFSYAKYLASQNEINQYSKLDSLNAKREFLYNFWRVRDDNPATAKNELKEEYMNRVAVANKSFSRMNKEGYLTDRGRVVLLFGEPDQKDYFPSESEVKPYEVWFYNQIEGGVTFIFGDVTGFGNYELLHSTKRGELKDENWIRRLRSQ